MIKKKNKILCVLFCTIKRYIKTIGKANEESWEKNEVKKSKQKKN